jgi:hypothetical protein
MNRILLWLIIVALLLGGLVLYRSRAGSDLNVTPDAAREIERAKRH